MGLPGLGNRLAGSVPAMKQILPPTRPDMRLCGDCETEPCACHIEEWGPGCEVCGEPCWGSRCPDHPDPRAFAGFDTVTVAEAMDGNRNTGERRP